MKAKEKNLLSDKKKLHFPPSLNQDYHTKES